MTMAKKLPLLAPSIHTFEVNGTYTDCEAKRTVFMAIQKMVSAGKYYRIPYHGSSKKGYSYKCRGFIKQYLQKLPQWGRFGVTSVTPFLLLPVHPEGYTPAHHT